MAGMADERAARHHKQAEHFQNLADMETEPRAREQLLRLAGEYRELADRTPQKPSAELFGPKAASRKIRGAAPRVDDRTVRES